MTFAYRNQNNAMAAAAYWRRPLAEKGCYQIAAQSDESAEILVYDIIGWPFNDAKEFIQAFSAITSKEILVRINSPGGDVIDTFAIYNAILSHKSTITTRNESLAASAASLLLIAGKKRQAYSNALTMIHNPWMAVIGDPDSLRAAADVGDSFLDNMVDMYADHTNVGKRDLRAMMKAETWMAAKEAQSKGFIDTIIDGKSVKAQFDLSMFANIPEGPSNDVQGRDLTRKETERALRNAGASREYARAVAAKRANASEEEGIAAITEAQRTLKILGGYSHGRA